MEFTKYEVNLGFQLAGFPTHSIQGPGEVEIDIKGFATPDDNGKVFYRMLENTSNMFLVPYLKDGKHFVSDINNCLVVLHKNQKATVYINAPLMVRIRTKKSIKKGQPLYKDDIADACDFMIQDVHIGDDEGVLFYFQVDWRQAFYFDLLPPDVDRREVPVEKELARFWAMLTFGEVFSLTDKDYSKLFDLGWFPFISIKKSLFQKLVDWSSSMCRFAIDRHSRAINMCFMDSSTRKVGLYDLWTLKWHRNAQPNYDVIIPWLPR